MVQDAEFLSRVSKIREESYYCGAFPIDFNDALILYTLAYILNSMLGCINIVEVGTGCGYSTSWLAKALKDSLACGKIISFEIDMDLQHLEIFFKLSQLMKF